MRPSPERAPRGTDGQFEALLVSAFLVTPSPADVARMDADLATAMFRHRRPARKRVPWILAAATTVFLVAGAGAIALQRFDGWGAPDFDVAWERATVVGDGAAVDGYRVTVDRAYADAGHVMVALGIEDLERRPGVTQIGGAEGSLTDDAGQGYPLAGGHSGPLDAHETAELWYFDPPVFPLEPGVRGFTLTVESIGVRDDTLDGRSPATPGPDGGMPDNWHVVTGPWVISFALDVGGGTSVLAGSSAESSGATVTAVSMLVSPTRTRLVLSIKGLEDAPRWQPVDVTVRHGASVIALGQSADAGDGTFVLSGQAGVDDPGGEWTIIVGQLVGPAPGTSVASPGPGGGVVDDSQRLDGPWVITLEMP